MHKSISQARFLYHTVWGMDFEMDCIHIKNFTFIEG